MSLTYISTLNRAKTAILAASTSAAGYPVDHLKEPEHLYGLTWRSTVTTDSWITIDLSAPTVLHRIGLFGFNFKLFRIQQHTSNVWTSPAFDSGTLASSRDPEQMLYRRWYASPSLTRRWTRILIPAQTPYTGVGYFSLAGIWMGTFAEIPWGFRFGYERELRDPRHVATSATGDVVKVIRTGDPSIVHRVTMQAPKDPTTPGQGDPLGGWMTIEGWLRDAPLGGLFCYTVDNWGDAAVYCGRHVEHSRWRDEEGVVERADFEIMEATAG